MQNHIDTLVFAINTILAWLKQDGVIPFIPAGVLGLYGFSTLMLEAYKKPTPPVWTWTIGFFVAWGWMFCLWQFYPYSGPGYEMMYGQTGTIIANAILSAMLSFITPFIIGLIPAVIWMFGVIAVEFFKDPEEFMRVLHGRRY